MNFFGHATVASWSRPDRPFVLGSMLPDFAGMIRQRPPEPTDPAVSAGIAFHHRTDDVFHRSHTFGSLERAARGELRDRGLARGASLAVAHVGIELILDDILGRDSEAADAFVGALGEGLTNRSQELLRWQTPGAPTHYRELLRALHERAAVHRPGSAEHLAWRVERALSGRPRLALRPGDREIVRDWAKSALPGVEVATPELVSELRRGLRL